MSATTTTDEQQPKKLSMAEKAKLKMRATRLVLYLNTAKEKMDENFISHPCLGLNFGFGEKELGRLQEAIKRHGREDQFDELTVPVDVLLRTLSFIPNPRDPRLIRHLTNAREQGGFVEDTTTMNARYKNNNNNMQPKSANTNDTNNKQPLEMTVEEALAMKNEAENNLQLLDLPQKTLLRLAATSSTLLYTIMENKCILGSKHIPSSLVEQAQRARYKFNDEERKRRDAERKKRLQQQQQQSAQNRNNDGSLARAGVTLIRVTNVWWQKITTHPWVEVPAPSDPVKRRFIMELQWKDDEEEEKKKEKEKEEEEKRKKEQEQQRKTIKVRNLHWRTSALHPFVVVPWPVNQPDKQKVLLSIEWKEEEDNNNSSNSKGTETRTKEEIPMFTIKNTCTAALREFDTVKFIKVPDVPSLPKEERFKLLRLAQEWEEEREKTENKIGQLIRRPPSLPTPTERPHPRRPRRQAPGLADDTSPSTTSTMTSTDDDDDDSDLTLRSDHCSSLASSSSERSTRVKYPTPPRRPKPKRVVDDDDTSTDTDSDDWSTSTDPDHLDWSKPGKPTRIPSFPDRSELMK